MRVSSLILLGVILLPFFLVSHLNQNVCMTNLGTTMLCPQADAHSPTGYTNSAGWAVNVDGSPYFDPHTGNMVPG